MSQAAVRQALLQYPLDGVRQWLSFTQPLYVIGADELHEVPSALAAAEQAVAQGNWVVGMVSYDAGPAFDQAVRSARMRRVPLVSFGVFSAPQRVDAPTQSGGYQVGPWVANRSQPAYLTTIRTIRELIGAGETYQVNHTVRLRSPFSGDPRGLFGDLVRAQQADHAAYLDLGDRAVCSVSPELFVSRRGRQLTARPMKGTIGRHPDPTWDALAAEHLARSEKDLAENTMIVDMVRNDLSRIADLGSVKVPALHTVESYPTVHTMTSTVTAESDASVAEVFAALFPPASITGAPKVRTTEIIEALEGDGRGVYTGAIGVLGPDGNFEFNIAIRTVWVDLAQGRAEYGVGGGIVWDSDPDEEWREVEQKTRVLNRARPDFRLLETMRWDPNQGVDLRSLHLERLVTSAQHFSFDLDLESVNHALDAVAAEGPRRLRLLVAPDGAVELQVLDLPLAETEPWLVPFNTHPVLSENEYLFHKTTYRDVFTQARERFPQAPDVVLWNERGELTETTTGNLVIEIDGQLVTPPVSCGLMPGTFRAHLLAQGAISEAPVLRTQVTTETKAWMINSVRHWVPMVFDFSSQSEENVKKPSRQI